MYRRTTGRVKSVSADIKCVEVQIPLNWRNVNYAGTMFGGSMLAATDPIMMIQLIQLLGKQFVVWDKAVQMRFKRPARERLYVVFEFTDAELEEIRANALQHGEYTYDKTIELRTNDGTVCAVGTKTMYVAEKGFYVGKRGLT